MTTTVWSIFLPLAKATVHSSVKANKRDCCSTVPNRLGEFYYPHGGRVSIYITGDGFYRNRRNQMIRLNRRDGVSSPTGTYLCEIPDVSDVTQKIFINISNDSE